MGEILRTIQWLTRQLCRIVSYLLVVAFVWLLIHWLVTNVVPTLNRQSLDEYSVNQLRGLIHSANNQDLQNGTNTGSESERKDDVIKPAEIISNDSLHAKNYKELLEHVSEESQPYTEELHAKYNEEFTQVSDLDIYVRSPFYDHRQAKKLIRMWGITLQQAPLVFCHVKFEPLRGNSYSDNSIFVVKAGVKPHDLFITRNCKWFAANVECKLPSTMKPTSVYISSSSERQSGNKWHTVHRPTFKPPSAPKYGICLVTIFDAPDTELHPIVEWLELQMLLGVHNVMLYGAINVTSGIKKALNIYVDSGFLIYDNWSIPVPTLSTNDYLKCKSNQNASTIDTACSSRAKLDCIFFYAHYLQLMDCLYRYGDDYTYLAIIDRDEFIVPTEGYGWKDFLEKIESEEDFEDYATVHFLDACFESAIIKDNNITGENMSVYMKTHEKTRRSSILSHLGRDRYVKSIIRPSRVISPYIHIVEGVIPTYNITKIIDPKIARKVHYRNPPGACKFADKGTEDDMMGRYHDDLLNNMESSLTKILSKVKQ